MATSVVDLVVNMPKSLHEQAQAAAKMRGATLSDVVRQALAEYIDMAEEEDDVRFADAALRAIAAGAPTYSQEEVRAEFDQLEAADALPD